jgi:two-component system, NtrC family, sensor kinase
LADSLKDSFQKDILTNVKCFADNTAKMMNSMVGTNCVVGNSILMEQGSHIEQKFFVSILFTGTVYGEYVLAMDEKVASAILGQQSIDQSDISDVFCEILNISVGESVLGLNKLYQKLTITPPRVYFGNVKYPKVKTGVTSIKCDQGAIECYLYIDRMQLDIATSYKDALASLTTAHAELQLAMEKLQTQQSLLVQNEKMAAFGTVAAGIAHEINTPLSIVSLVGGQMKELVQEPSLVNTGFDIEGFSTMLTTIDKTVARISKITKSLWSLAHRMQNDTVVPFLVKELMEDTLLLCDFRLKGAGVELTLNSFDDTLTVEGRMPELSQLVLNVLMNACDAIEKMPEKWIKIDVVDNADKIEIRITDSGKGIPLEIRKRIFEPFFTTKDNKKSPGLGMSISKRIIEEHNGTISIDSSSKYTCFSISLPKTVKKTG